MISPVLTEIFVVFCLAVLVLLVCNKLKVPAIVGYLLTGILAGPHGLGLVRSVEQVEQVAEIGVIMLLFSIGLEFSFRQLMAMKRVVFIGGAIQVLLTIALSAAISYLLGLSFNSSLFMGFLIALSSTAIVIKQLNERGEIAAPHGNSVLGILIFQDLIIVPMMLLTPLLAEGGGSTESVWLILAKIAGVLFLVFLLAKVVIPPLLYRVARTQSNELFLLCVIVICFGVAWVTNLAGLSLALGAFLAGMIIADSEYSHQALGNITPFINVFTSLFFISVGMLLNSAAALSNIGLVIFLVAVVLLGKALIAALAALVLGYPLRVAVLVGLALGQIGEFSFLLAQTGVEYRLIGDVLYQGFLSASIITMMMTPFLIALAPRAAAAIGKLPLPERIKNGRMAAGKAATAVELDNHLIIVGYGINGRNLAAAADFAHIPYVVLELNAATVRHEKCQGVPVMYGDATNEEVLHAAGIDKAKMMVIAMIPKPASASPAWPAGSVPPCRLSCAPVLWLRWMS
ncbi:MAG: monovalent cation:proton antiporter-2 (CPA2) family protein [Syntrophomonadaceae bacterium]|nr:monovalent cation:proton antiporter-2 (CPA2) family protein [Syntrophomonadaceae bacterium]